MILAGLVWHPPPNESPAGDGNSPSKQTGEAAPFRSSENESVANLNR